MCVIAVCTERKLTRQEIETCASRNPDGIGIGWHAQNAGREWNHLRKGFVNVGEFHEFYEAFDVLPHIVHFRVATSGGVKPELCHPFIVSQTSPLVLEWTGQKALLFHNGAIGNWRHLLIPFLPELRRGRSRALPPGPWSDTRVAAVLVALLGEEVLELLDGKFALLDRRGLVYLYGDFEEVDGVRFSNGSYRPYGLD